MNSIVTDVKRFGYRCIINCYRPSELNILSQKYVLSDKGSVYSFLRRN